jgi:hypothetical protein
MLQRVLLATFSNTLSSSRPDACCPPLRHFDPFGTEFCEPGRVNHPPRDFRFLIADSGLSIRRVIGDLPRNQKPKIE